MNLRRRDCQAGAQRTVNPKKKEKRKDEEEWRKMCKKRGI